MRKYYLHVLLVFVWLSVIPSSYVHSQCMSGGQDQIGFSYTPSCQGIDTINEYGSRDSAYVHINLSAGVHYIFGSSITTDYITISDIEGNESLAFGVQPLEFTPDTTGKYRFYIHASGLCGNDDLSRIRTMQCVPVPNDLPETAIELSLGAGCNTIYSNVAAHHTEGEPHVSCKSTAGVNTMWFKFSAPASGAVKISTDYSLLQNIGPLDNTRIELYATNNPADYTSFVNIACDDDNGVLGDGENSIVYAAGLVPNQTYYIAFDRKNSYVTKGSFCITVDELDQSMLAASGECTDGQRLQEYQEEYNGWLSMTDIEGKLIANIRPNEAGNVFFQASPTITVHEGEVRNDPAGKKYLNRNYDIGSFSNDNDVQFFFLNSELMDLSEVDPDATIDNLNVTIVHTFLDCFSDFQGDASDISLLAQTASGNANGVAWVQTTVPDFSNFYIHSGSQPLPITLIKFTGSNDNTKNIITWESAKEIKGDFYQLEKSIDGKTFKEIATKTANGFASTYEHIDNDVFVGNNYYRLKLINADGTISYSKMITIDVINDKTTIIVTPNPVTDKLTIHANSKGIFSITDITGKEILKQSCNKADSLIDMSSFSSGIYFFKFNDGIRSQTIKINKL